jgi:archaeosine-15-forming tRNA-guanine transglycosylase
MLTRIFAAINIDEWFELSNRAAILVDNVLKQDEQRVVESINVKPAMLK